MTAEVGDLSATGHAAEPGRLRRFLEAWGPALPLLGLVGAMLVAPAVQLVVGSFLRDGTPTLANWLDVLASGRHQGEIAGTLLLAGLSASVATVVGVPVAWFVHRMVPVRRSAWLGLLNVAANIGGIGLGFALVATLGTVGMVTLLVGQLGLGWDPPALDSFGGLALGYAYTNVPLFVLLTLPAMGVLRTDWWDAAQVASATRRAFWRRIGLPVLAPFIAAGWLLIFTWSVGIYSLAYALAGTGAIQRVPLITLRIGVVIQSDVYTTWRASVLSVILMAIALVALAAYRTLLRRAVRWL
jgi:putative spermidine/putrescine transport system permease protein